MLFGDDWEEIRKKKSYYEGEALLTEKSHSLLFVKDMLATMGYSNTQPSQVLDLSEVLLRLLNGNCSVLLFRSLNIHLAILLFLRLSSCHTGFAYYHLILLRLQIMKGILLIINFSGKSFNFLEFFLNLANTEI